MQPKRKYTPNYLRDMNLPELTPQQARDIDQCEFCQHDSFRYRRIQPQDLYHQRAMQRFAWTMLCDRCGGAQGRVIKHISFYHKIQDKHK